MDKKVKVVKLKNRYSSEIVLTENYDDIRKEGNYEFILVYHAENPGRKFLVNRQAYEIVNK
jgi:hypothetical protein